MPGVISWVSQHYNILWDIFKITNIVIWDYQEIIVSSIYLSKIIYLFVEFPII